METDIHFTIGTKTFDEVAELASRKGIRLEPLVRITNEKYPGSSSALPEGFLGRDSIDINGVLWFKDESFIFTLHLVEKKAGSLQVDVGEKNLITANQLVETLNADFPTDDILPMRITATSTKAIWDQLGCLVLLFIIFACFYFFGYGVYRFFTSP